MPLTNGQTPSAKITLKRLPAIFTLQFSPLQLNLTCKILHNFISQQSLYCYAASPFIIRAGMSVVKSKSKTFFNIYLTTDQSAM